MKHTLFLFDIDGTLLTTHGGGQRAMQTAAQRLFGERFSYEGVEFAGGIDPQLFSEAAHRSGMAEALAHEAAFRDQYVVELRSELARTGNIEPMPGIPSLVETLRSRMEADDGVMLGLLSGNYHNAAPLKLDAIGLDARWFPITAFGDDAATRPDLPPVAMARYHRHTGRQADPRRVVVIGDTPRDVECARAHDCVPFGVATGRSSVADLKAAGAEIAVESLADPSPLLALIDS